MSEQAQQSLLVYRIKFVALILVFLLPFIAGWLAFYVFELRPGTRNYGELVVPVRQLQLSPLTSVNGETLSADFWHKWTFVVVDNQGCQQSCRNNLYYLRQLRIALGRDTDRVQNLLLLAGEAEPALRQYLVDFPKLNTVANTARDFIEQFSLPGIPAGEQAVVYLVDPRGNLMMTYPAENDPSSILSDLRRLLKVSQIG